MDDLAGLDWNAQNQSSNNRPPPLNNTVNYYPSLKPTPPLSGRSTPAVVNVSKPPATPGNAPATKLDSFANLLPTSTANQTTKTLSLKEQQERLEEQKRQKAVDQARQWETLGIGSTSTSASVSRTASPASFSVQALNGQSSGQRLPIRTTTPIQNASKDQPKRKQSEDVNDILAAFDASAPVDSSTNFPIPSRPESRNILFANKAAVQPAAELFGDDDDPFGLGTTPATTQRMQKSKVQTQDDDIDVLGLLGKPVSELPPPKATTSASKNASHPADAAVAELVDMGFDAEKARHALATTESGLDVQGAVGYLLNQAHSESKHKVRETSRPTNGDRRRQAEDVSPQDSARAQPKARSRRELDQDESVLAKDPSKYASEIGSNLFKTANSLWKAGQKKVNKAIADYNTEGDSSQPKWMRGAAMPSETSPVEATSRDRPRHRPTQNGDIVHRTERLTDEAALLEMDGGRPQPVRKNKPSAQPARNLKQDTDGLHERRKSPHNEDTSSAPAESRFAASKPSTTSAARERLTREMNEEASAYVSPARRRKATPQPVEPEPNLLFDDGSATIAAKPKSTQSTATSVVPPRSTATKNTVKTATPAQVKTPPRNVPPVSASILQSSTSNRASGTAAFKLGNYSDAHTSYTAALRDIPKQHPLIIVLLTNRALTSLKTGDPKQCIADADQALEVIGPGKGAKELINLGGTEGNKDMAPYWGKAMMRRAEAMEQLERWSDAAKVWKECVEVGVGGAQSVQGRARCEKASGANPPAQSAPKKPTAAPKKVVARPVARSAMDDLSGRPIPNSADSSEAVTRLRAANDAAAKLDDERFALTDAVADRVEKWKKGKEQNLRALLGSLDTVLWADSGWKKIGMGDLLNPSKVKINYMKGIAKVHPDKLPNSATTEQIMISGAVFSTLNEAWDGFKKENGL